MEEKPYEDQRMNEGLVHGQEELKHLVLGSMNGGEGVVFARGVWSHYQREATP